MGSGYLISPEVTGFLDDSVKAGGDGGLDLDFRLGPRLGLRIRRNLALKNLALQQQPMVLERQMGTVRLKDRDRVFLDMAHAGGSGTRIGDMRPHDVVGASDPSGGLPQPPSQPSRTGWRNRAP